MGGVLKRHHKGFFGDGTIQCLDYDGGHVNLHM